MLNNILSVVRLSNLRPLSTACIVGALTACQPTTPVTPMPGAPATLPASPPKTSAELELQWAHAALERNPNFKVISVDINNNTIKLQVRSTGESINVTPGELAAVPLADLMTLTQAASMNEPVKPPSVHEGAAAAIPSSESATSKATTNDSRSQFIVQREAGRVHVTGPGVDIESRPNTSTAAATKSQTTDEPLICEGRRMLHLDGRHLHVDGDAIVVRGGCELHLTNSSVDATGVGIVVDDGSVHIANSTVQGESASLQIEARAKAYVRNSKFIGISRRDAAAELSDLGGNQWQTSAQ